jgi:hypothetical protein
MLGQIIRYKSKKDKIYYMIIGIEDNNYILYNSINKERIIINKSDKELFIVDDFDIKYLQSLYLEYYDFFNSNILFKDYNIKNPTSAQSRFYIQNKSKKSINNIMLVQIDDNVFVPEKKDLISINIGTFVNISIMGKILSYDKEIKKYLIQTNIIDLPIKLCLSKQYNIGDEININVKGNIMEYIDNYYLISTTIYETPIKIMPEYIISIFN